MNPTILIGLLQAQAGTDYIGEPVSQLEHALQAADLAMQAGASEAQALAALLHDVGHVCCPGAEEMAGLGVARHEQIGADFLREQGLPEEVARLVSLHVDAKRYLASRNGYMDKLSEASRGTLIYQGGPMTDIEARQFESDPLFRAALQQRAWDDAAKEPGKTVPGVAHYQAMLARHLPLTSDERVQWQDKGFLHIRGWFSANEMKQVAAASQKLHDLPETPGKWMKYFENNAGLRQLCRIENFLQYDPVFDEAARGVAVMHLLEQLLGEPVVIFKEKVNFKLPGGQGFAPHQDAPAFASFAQDYHVTAMLSIDAATVENGCLEIVDSETWRELLPMKEDLTLTDEFVEGQIWRPIETAPGDLLIFDSFLPHRSGINKSAAARRALYTTYNLASAGSFRDDYFRTKRASFPPDVEREPGRTYDKGLFNVGNPVSFN